MPAKFTFKIILIRPPGIGTIIDNITITRFSGSYKQTIGVDILTKDVEFREGEIALLKIFDINTHPFKYSHKSFYQDTHGTLVFFDLTNRGTYENAKKIYGEIKEVNGKIPFILIGDNAHLEKLINDATLREEARNFARNEGGVYIEVSPSMVVALEKAIIELIRIIIDQYLKKDK